MWDQRVHYVVPKVLSSKFKRWLCGTVGSVLIVALVVMWGHVLDNMVLRGHIMGIAGLVISYDVNNYQARRGGLCR